MKKELINISKILQLHFSFLSESNFSFLKKRIDKYFIEHIYTKENLYIKIEISVHPRDFPFYFRIILGEGNTEFPESDWNSVSLWRIDQINHPSSKAGYYTLENINDVEKFLKKAVEDLKIVGEDFLNGKLESFNISRKNQNINREPYKIYSKDENGQYQFEYDPKIVELKNKFT